MLPKIIHNKINDNVLSNTESTDEEWINFMNSISSESDESESLNFDKITENSFSLDNNYININLEKNIDINVITENICEKCNISCKTLNGIIYCELCRMEDKIETDNITFNSENNHNTNNNSFMAFNFTGNGSYCYQRSFLKSCANYSSFRKNNNRKDMYNYNYKYEGNKLPKNVIKLAIELFSTIKDNKYVYRGNGKKGIIGACLFYACVINKITKTPREIANILGIEERFLSQGDRTIQELNEKGVINIPTILRPIDDYLNQYFALLKINMKYKPFIIDVIDRIDKKNIHIVNDSRTTTKAIGTIYLLINRLKKYKNINKEMIVKECKISKSTFIRYYNLLLKNNIYIRPIFKRHKIPMPNEWKSREKQIETPIEI
jgi:transcription initiation factor TFIIIB Brf1 subunit/transcription initiation factor TFIIB